MNIQKPISECRRRRIEAIYLLLAHDRSFIDTILNDDLNDLRFCESKIIEIFEGYSSGQQLLVRIAMDIWSFSGNSNLSDIISRLDPSRSKSFLKAMNRFMTTTAPVLGKRLPINL